MKIIFREASGLSIQGEFSNNDKVSSAIMFLSKKLNISQFSIRFLSSDQRNRHFYHDDIDLNLIVERGYAYFTIFPDISLTQLEKKLENSEIEIENKIKKQNNNNLNSSKYYHPKTKYDHYHPRYFNQHMMDYEEDYDTTNDNLRPLRLKHDLSDSFVRLIQLNKLENRQYSSKKSILHLPHHNIFRDYNRIIQATPRNWENQIQQLHSMGFDQEDCKEALRACNFNIERASDYIVNMNRSNNKSSRRYNFYDDDYMYNSSDYLMESRFREYELMRHYRNRLNKRKAPKSTDTNTEDDDDSFFPLFNSDDDDDRKYLSYSSYGFASPFFRLIIPMFADIIDDLSPGGQGVDNRILIEILREVYLETTRRGNYNPIFDQFIILIRERKKMENESEEEESNYNGNEQSKNEDYKALQKKRNYHDESSYEEEDENEYDFESHDLPMSPFRLISLYQRSRSYHDGQRRISSKVMRMVERIEESHKNIRNEQSNPKLKLSKWRKPQKITKKYEIEPSKNTFISESRNTSISSNKQDNSNDNTDVGYSFIFDELDIDLTNTSNLENNSKSTSSDDLNDDSKEDILSELMPCNAISIEKNTSNATKTKGTQIYYPPPPPPSSSYLPASRKTKRKLRYPPPDNLRPSKKAPSASAKFRRKDISEEDMNFLNEFAQNFGMPLDAIIDAFQQVGNDRQALAEFFS